MIVPFCVNPFPMIDRKSNDIVGPLTVNPTPPPNIIGVSEPERPADQ